MQYERLAAGTYFYPPSAFSKSPPNIFEQLLDTGEEDREESSPRQGLSVGNTDANSNGHAMPSSKYRREPSGFIMPPGRWQLPSSPTLRHLSLILDPLTVQVCCRVRFLVFLGGVCRRAHQFPDWDWRLICRVLGSPICSNRMLNADSRDSTPRVSL